MVVRPWWLHDADCSIPHLCPAFCFIILSSLHLVPLHSSLASYTSLACMQMHTHTPHTYTHILTHAHAHTHVHIQKGTKTHTHLASLRFHYTWLAWLPTFLTTTLSVDLTSAAHTALLPPLAGVAASGIAGVAGDGLLKLGVPTHVVRK
jgi:hypothetical protein